MITRPGKLWISLDHSAMEISTMRFFYGKIHWGESGATQSCTVSQCFFVEFGETGYRQSMDWFLLGKSKPETIDFPMKIMGFSCKCSLKPIHWDSFSMFWTWKNCGPRRPSYGSERCSPMFGCFCPPFAEFCRHQSHGTTRQSVDII